MMSQKCAHCALPIFGEKEEIGVEWCVNGYIREVGLRGKTLKNIDTSPPPPPPVVGLSRKGKGWFGRGQIPVFTPPRRELHRSRECTRLTDLCPTNQKK